MAGEFGDSPETSPPACCNGSAAELLAAGGGGARPVADDNAEGPVASGSGRDGGNAAKDSQTAQYVPVKGEIAGTTRSTMIA